MEALKKRSTAMIIAVIVIIFGTLFGVHRSVGAQTKKIEAMFYNGVFLEEENYTQTSIDSQLNKRETAALGLVTVANHYDALEDKTESLRQVRIALLDAETIPRKYAANEAMQSACEALYGALVVQSLTDSEAAARRKLRRNAGTALRASSRGALTMKWYRHSDRNSRRSQSAF